MSGQAGPSETPETHHFHAEWEEDYFSQFFFFLQSAFV